MQPQIVPKSSGVASFKIYLEIQKLGVFTDFDGLHGFEILLSIKAIVWWYKKLGLGTTLNSSYLYLKWVKIVQSYFYYD